MQMIINPPGNPVAFKIFDFSIRWYGIILSCAIFLGIFLIYKLIHKKFSNLEADFFIDFAPCVVFFSILGARLFYVIGEIEHYAKNPLEILMIHHGGLSIWGAIIFGFLCVFITSYKKNINPFKILDGIAVVMPLCQAIGRWGNYFNQEAYGKPTDFIIKMYISPANRTVEYINFDYFHPTFLYESILDLLIFSILLYLFLKLDKYKISFFTWSYLALYSLTRIFVENLRIDSILNVGIMPVAQVISVIMLIVSISVLIFMHKKKRID